MRWEDAQVDITVDELKARMDRGDDFALLDVREPYENSICSLPNSTLIPMGELVQRLGEIDAGRDVVVYCHSGNRSRTVVNFLRRQGYTRAVNLHGGILEWIDRVDPSLTRY
jgi:adenylyltransferase/sulfurtransferase